MTFGLTLWVNGGIVNPYRLPSGACPDDSKKSKGLFL